jgi:quercetin dioxygenase-like cupin family protein
MVQREEHDPEKLQTFRTRSRSSENSAAFDPNPVARKELPMRAFKLYIGSDNASHLLEGEVALDKSTDVVSLHFQESPPGSATDWHVAPHRQYILTLTGTLEFTTRDDEVFIISPGDVLVAGDTVGSGHKWRLIDEAPWRRCYVVLKPGAADLFVANG